MSDQSAGGTYRPYFVADRPNHINILSEAAEETGQFGVVVRATVTETVQDLVADLPVPVFVDCGAFAEGGAIQSLHDQLVTEVLDTARTSMPSLTSYSEVAPDGGCVKHSTDTDHGRGDGDGE